MNRTLFAAGAAFILALAPAVHAQASCADINRLLEEAEDDFKGIRGEEFEETFYETSVSLPGAVGCEIMADWDSIYQCGWLFFSREAAQAHYESQRAAMQTCLPAWATRIEPEQDTADGDGLRHLIGVSFTGDDDYLDMEWLIDLDERVKGDQTHYELVVALTYYFD